ncbi:hypothetical protein [Geotalea sp. SG265]|uniref:hypothetical protein n=1 Tax=Geotalea sp. SG265 TaxID=2922867 RepID=UPI001FAF544D|nr:hypothetical protein [Geotalea sp. SG265]
MNTARKLESPSWNDCKKNLRGSGYKDKNGNATYQKALHDLGAHDINSPAELLEWFNNFWEPVADLAAAIWGYSVEDARPRIENLIWRLELLLDAHERGEQPDFYLIKKLTNSKNRGVEDLYQDTFINQDYFKAVSKISSFMRSENQTNRIKIAKTADMDSSALGYLYNDSYSDTEEEEIASSANDQASVFSAVATLQKNKPELFAAMQQEIKEKGLEYGSFDELQAVVRKYATLALGGTVKEVADVVEIEAPKKGFVIQLSLFGEAKEISVAKERQKRGNEKRRAFYDALQTDLKLEEPTAIEPGVDTVAEGIDGIAKPMKSYAIQIGLFGSDKVVSLDQRRRRNAKPRRKQFMDALQVELDFGIPSIRPPNFDFKGGTLSRGAPYCDNRFLAIPPPPDRYVQRYG